MAYKDAEITEETDSDLENHASPSKLLLDQTIAALDFVAL
jgi:hypothetical protein